MNEWLPKVGKVELTKGVSVLDEVKDKGCPARERESLIHIHFPIELTAAVEHFYVPFQTVQKKFFFGYHEIIIYGDK